MAYERPDWTRLAEVYEAALTRAVNFTMKYNENTDTFLFRVNGLHPSEDYVGKERSFDTSVNDVLDFLRGTGIWASTKGNA